MVCPYAKIASGTTTIKAARINAKEDKAEKRWKGTDGDLHVATKGRVQNARNDRLDTSNFVAASLFIIIASTGLKMMRDLARDHWLKMFPNADKVTGK